MQDLMREALKGKSLEPARGSTALNRITLEFVADIAGARTYRVPSGKSYRFDKGMLSRQPMDYKDALALIERWGPKTFRLLERTTDGEDTDTYAP